MSFPSEIYYRARERKKEQKREAESAAKEREAELIRRSPKYKELKLRLGQTSCELARLVLGEAGDIDAIREKNVRTQNEFNELLNNIGVSTEYIRPAYSCPLCQDEGMIGGRVCDCLVELMKKLSYEELNARTPLGSCSFDSFRLSHYPDEAESAKGLSPRKIMERTLERCRRYADSFTEDSPSLLFQGGVGLGKTHLSLAIAGEVLEKGYSVLYGSAGTYFDRIEKEHFNKNVNTDTRYLLESCDLLIMDDLGAEFTTQFTVATLLGIVNARLLTQRPTIISTNLNLGGLEDRYTERLVSRLYGSYQRFQFVGKDLRIILRKARNADKSGKDEE